MNTHCLPSGSLGTGELPCNEVNANTLVTYPASTGVGNRRGVVVYMYGLDVYLSPTYPIGLGSNSNAGALSGYNALQAQMLNNDGWEVIVPAYQENNYVGIPAVGMFNDIQNDPAYGARYLASTMHWWDHVIDYIHTAYGNWPIVLSGGSHGGGRTISIVANATAAQMPTAYMAQYPWCAIETLSNAYAVNSGQWGLLNASGLTLSLTALNNVTIPGIIGYGTNDSAVGYGSSTVASGTGAITAAAVATAGVLYVASFSTFVGGVGKVLVTGLTGGTGQAVFAYTGTSSSGGNHLTGVTLISGSGTLATGLPVIQNCTSALIANQRAAQSANPSYQVTANVSQNYHAFLQGDAGVYTTPTGISGNVALSTLGTLNVGSTVSVSNVSFTNLVSGACAIMDTTGVYHTITFGSSTSTKLSTVTYSGSNSALVNNSSSICQTNFAVGASYPYWLNQTVDPSCPAIH